MKVQAPFGFVTGCHEGDKFMVQATLASMKHYCPGVPICLVVDGEFDVSDLERAYGVISLRVPDLPLKEMRNLVGGNYRAKLAAMWEGPFEFYVWMDSDAIVWGDFTKQLRTDCSFQIFWNEISISPDAAIVPNWLRHYYFDPDKLLKFDSRFVWRGNAYFSAGTYACRKNVISFEKWMTVEAWNKSAPGLFSDFGDMGPLNYLVHSMGQRGEIRLGEADLQHVPMHHGMQELESDCNFKGNWRFPSTVRRPRIVHFCGRKPFLFDRKAYSRPFTIARLAHHLQKHNRAGAWLRVLNEECKVIAEKLRRKLSCNRLLSRFV
jgi:hypothetical protein